MARPADNAANRKASAQSDGERDAFDAVLPEVYVELRRLASRHLRAERKGHTLQTTALVHEAYLRLAGARELEWKDRAHFLTLATRAIRRILVDHARRREANVRGGAWHRLSVADDALAGGDNAVDMLALDAALARLQALHERQARVVELRFFAGLTLDETARALGVSRRTVDGDWSIARAWLAREVEREAER